MTGAFLLEQLQRLDAAAGGKATFAFGATAFVSALKSEVRYTLQGQPALLEQKLWARGDTDSVASCLASPAALPDFGMPFFHDSIE